MRTLFHKAYSHNQVVKGYKYKDTNTRYKDTNCKRSSVPGGHPVYANDIVLSSQMS